MSEKLDEEEGDLYRRMSFEKETLY